ncbi:GNAT family N-acetyltransferase [Flaviflexus huanghaiensis]|uniref:GNAT family N-acetyltransferase n=1 Tax=Flaviflexus huanghaiensis TaxID=1111473 RepID=UPI0015F91D89|nr:GNAT family N-acetyltransferase [Flaviflexus huanghaiensis]
MGMDRATEVFWNSGAERWDHLVERGTALLFETGDDYAILAVTSEPVRSLEDLLAREGEEDFFRMSAIGNPDSINRRLDDMREEMERGTFKALQGRGTLPPPAYAMFEERTLDGLSDHHREWFGKHEGHRWDFFWSDEPLETPQGDEYVQLLDVPTWRSEIERVISASNPSTTALADLDELLWYGYVEGDLLGGAMGVERRGQFDGTLASHFAGLGTDPDRQGRGIGGAVMAGAINRELKETAIVTFGMWSWNDRARRLYRKLGINEGHTYVTLATHPLQEYDE